MNLKFLLRSAAAFLLAAAMLSTGAPAAAVDSADVVSIALGEVGYIEREDEYSKYGEWYGYPNGYWCDMFVSWCAMTAGASKTQFPRESSCTSHVKLFSKAEWYRYSAARGGTYIPQQGDVIFFYNYLTYPTGKISNHTGIVLYVEDGYVYTIEGNALTNRLDYPYAEIAALRDDAAEPLDHVVVNRYPLNAPQIHGYGIPAYDSRTPLELEGFVDLGRHAGSAGVFQYLCGAGVMTATSAHTFSPDHGMTRGEFLTLVVDFFGIPNGGVTAAPFDDIPLDSVCYPAVIAARAAGLINGAEENRFLPELYISPEDAQAVFDRVLAYLGLETQFSFSSGDYSYMLTPYTIRADIAQAFYALCRLMPRSEAFDGKIFLGETECPARSLDGACYVPVQSLQQAFPELELAEDKAGIAQIPPAWSTDRVLPALTSLRYEEKTVEINSFVHQGTLYMDLYAAAAFLTLDLEYAEDEMPQDCPDSTVTIIRFSDPSSFCF